MYMHIMYVILTLRTVLPRCHPLSQCDMILELFGFGAQKNYDVKADKSLNRK